MNGILEVQMSEDAQDVSPIILTEKKVPKDKTTILNGGLYAWS